MVASVQTIVQGVVKKDYGVQLLAKGSGAAPVPELVRLLRDPDAEIRQLAVYCLSATGDPSAADGLAGAVLDADPQVALVAAKALRGLAGPPLGRVLLHSFDQASEPMVRREVAIVLGRIAGPPELLAMKQRWETAPPGEAREGLTVALADRGDEDARREFEVRLLASEGDDRLRWMENADLLAQPWLLPVLGKILDDPTPLLRVAVDARPDLIQALRVCDLALILIAKITGVRFSFPVTRAHNFTPAELDEARRLVKASKP